MVYKVNAFYIPFGNRVVWEIFSRFPHTGNKFDYFCTSGRPLPEQKENMNYIHLNHNNFIMPLMPMCMCR